MHPLLIYVAAATFGFPVGWERLPEGGMEYVIQLDSTAIEILRDGQPLQSAIPADAGEIRAVRIVMGPGTPKRETPLPKLPPMAAKPAPVEPAKAAPAEPLKPAQSSLSLTLTILGLFASLGANVFLGWLAWGFRRRCQSAA